MLSTHVTTALKKNTLRSSNLAIRRYTDGSFGQGNGFGQFYKREKAKEDYFIKQHEKEQMSNIKEQLKKYHDRITDLENKIDQIDKNNRNAKNQDSK